MWGDLLTSYNGQTITYDNIGNPTQYRDGMSFSWQNGRELATFTKTGTTASYKYNDSGIRTQKIANGKTTDYYLNGDSVVGQIRKNSSGTVLSTIYYNYDEKGDLIGFNLKNSTYQNGADFYYIRNGQNYIIGILDDDGNQVVSYVYDTWGKLISTTGSSASTVGVINPYRYRGYRYDTETGFYYLNSRYYDPDIGRFIKADNVVNGTASIHGYNLFQYCNNNPVNMSDPSGHWPQWISNIAKAACKVVTIANAIISIPSTVVKIAVALTVAVVRGKATVKDVANDAKNYSFFNSDEKKVLKSKVFSSYNGTPILRHSVPRTSSFSISNTIILNRSENENNGGIDAVKHEWGHTVQESLLGTSKYISRIAVPSIIGYINEVDDYYSQPWERSADFFGNANNGPYRDGSGFRAGLYFIMP